RALLSRPPSFDHEKLAGAGIDREHERIMTNQLADWSARLIEGGRLSDEEALSLAACTDLDGLVAAGGRLRDHGFGDTVTVSRKVFIPLTRLCRDVCHYCTFAKAPRHFTRAFMTPEEVLEVARNGVAAGCDEALFT